MPFSCEKCFHIFDSQAKLDQHTNKRIPCIVGETDDENIKCDFCQNSFSTISSLNRHQKNRCAVIKNPDLLLKHIQNQKKLLNNIIKQRNELIEELKSKNPNSGDTNFEKLEHDKTKKFKKSDNILKCEEMNVENRCDFVYVIKEREFIKTKENIYKIGRTKNGPSKRVSQYPNDSIVFNIIKVPDSKKYSRESLYNVKILV
jgi:hypothetical protein